jgi:hypothetical protein
MTIISKLCSSRIRSTQKNSKKGKFDKSVKKFANQPLGWWPTLNLDLTESEESDKFA